MRPLPFLLGAALFPGALCAAITVSGVSDNSYYTDSATFTITADAGFTFTATLDGAAVAVGSAVQTQAVGFHDLQVTKTPTGGGTAETLSLQFIIRSAERGSTESGLPAWTPHPVVADAPSAFASGTLSLIAPSAWPKDLALPLVAKLATGSGEGLRLNGRVFLTGMSNRSLWLRRGWGSRLLPAIATAGPVELAGNVQGLAGNRVVTIEDDSSWTDVSGVISSDTNWPANSRIHVTGTLTINAGSTLGIAAGSIVKIDPGVEILADGSLQVDGTLADPVVFTPQSSGEPWGGIELNAATSRVHANGTIFTGAGADLTWFSTHSGYASHRKEQALFLVGASGAELHTADVWMIDLAGQAMNSRGGGVIDLQRTLIQRCTTGGELNNSTVTVDRSAVMEIPSDSPEFVDGDNDGLYFTGGTQTVSRTVIGWTKDDGIDSGGDGGAGTITTLQDNWYESTFHEAHSLSGQRSVSFSGCVFNDCGQGVECGYGASAGGPQAVIDGCVFTGNLVGARFGDNYDWTYNGALEVKNSILTGDFYHDVWGYDWTSWSYKTAPTFNVHDNRIGMPDAVHHPLNTAWNAAADGSLLAPFMPLPDSDVGIGLLLAESQADSSAYPGSFTVRLSSFSSKQVSANWTLSGAAAGQAALQPIASGSVSFASGETLKTIAAPLADPGSYDKLVLHLDSPVAAAVTGPDAWFFRPTATEDPVLIAKGSGGWRYREMRSDPPAGWKGVTFDDSSAAATEWRAATLPAGFGSISGVTFATTVASGPSGDRTHTYYFRKAFTVADPSKVTALTLKIRRDDGVLAWLNDAPQPIANSTDGALLPVPSTYATFAPNATNVATFSSFAVPVSSLVTGGNILAIELHQTSLTSSDLLLDAELVATYRAPLALSQEAVGMDHIIHWDADDAVLETSGNLLNWVPLPEATSPWPVTPAPAAGPFFRLRR